MVHTLQWPRLATAFSRLGLPVVVVDLESTGGHFYQDRITEIAVLRFDQGSVQKYEWLLNPQQSISDFIAHLTGITDEMVEGMPFFSDIAADLLPILQGSLLVAHNSRFDYTFLRHEFGRVNMNFAAPCLCTVQLSRRLYPQFYKHSLDVIIERLGIEVENRHRAMVDVVALCDFLEKSLHEKGDEEWNAHCRGLMTPKMLPIGLSNRLTQQLYKLPDAHGVLVWLDDSGQVLEISVHERTYSEVTELLNGKKRSYYVEVVAQIRFLSALGGLHALYLKAQEEQKYGIRPSESIKNYFTIQFAPDEQGRLQARIVHLKNGCHLERPFGLFVHKKAAKRALLAWAQQHHLCPDSLNILPKNHIKNAPCPMLALEQCDGLCQEEEGILIQNRRIVEYAHLLPVVDWGHVHEVEVIESSPFSEESVRICCISGALVLPDGRWYFDETLPMILKKKWKQKECIRVLS